MKLGILDVVVAVVLGTVVAFFVSGCTQVQRECSLVEIHGTGIKTFKYCTNGYKAEDENESSMKVYKVYK